MQSILAFLDLILADIASPKKENMVELFLGLQKIAMC